ncbi:hypothetical protein FB645_005736 [Coemansia sp. IMI 203386]|nr:hypothetical protein FB645_005736 [Coemansia sp. IMI 203386]
MRQQTECPGSFTQWTSKPHKPYSSGPLRLPSMRPSMDCRSFVSPAVEQFIANTSQQINSADIRQLFANTMASTLDTAIAWHNGEFTFVITGDINAQWTRDSTNQLLPLLPHVQKDVELQKLVAGLVNMQAEQLALYPYANAYQPPERSGLVPAENSWAKSDRAMPNFDPDQVFEAKFEIDSLAAFLKLSTAYWRQTKAMEYVKMDQWKTAVVEILDLLVKLQQPTYDSDGRLTDAVFSFSRTSGSGTETSFGHGRGNPVRRTGMVRSLFRPSDDSVVFPFFVPGNAMLAVELENLARMLQAMNVMAEERQKAQKLANEIRQGIADHAVYQHPKYGPVYVYETDGYGSHLIMDDANIPSLLSLPYLGYVSINDSVYQNTRKLVLSADNPWYFSGSSLTGIGSPHTGFRKVWPMAVAVQALTSESKEERVKAIEVLASTTGGLGLMHESADVDDPTKYSRPWFAWCNGVFSELIVDTVGRFPGSI